MDTASRLSEDEDELGRRQGSSQKGSHFLVFFFFFFLWPPAFCPLFLLLLGLRTMLYGLQLNLFLVPVKEPFFFFVVVYGRELIFFPEPRHQS